MNDDIRRLTRWLRRAQPPLGSLFRALVSGIVATVSNVALLVGAAALLVESATRPGLRAVAGVLIVIELLAFLRSPIRFNERLSSHRLGFSAVTRWRHWLVETVGLWSYDRWRTYAAGDLLERSLRDTDELQDLWLRCVVPGASVVLTALLGDLFIGLLPPHGSWWPVAGLLALCQLVGLVGLGTNLGSLVRRDRRLRLVRAHYQATLVELSAAAPELLLLGGDDFVQQHLAQARQSLRLGERGLARQRRATGAVAPIATIAALATLAALHPRTSPLWIVVAALLALSTFEALATLRGALDTAVAISAAAERLEDLEMALPGGDQPWPGARTLRADHLVLREGDALLLKDGSLRLRAGHHLAVTGPSGSGKSTLLRTLGALDTVRGGRVSIEETELTDLGEDELRRHLAYVPSEPGLTRGFARDVVHMGRSGTRDFLIDLAALGLFVDPNGKWDELSRGERARVAIVRAMVTSPDIYLLDEPTGALGGEETSAVLALLAETGASVVVVTHDSMVMDWCDEVLELRDGELRFLSR